MEELTARQAQVAGFICRFRECNGFPPSRREIAKFFGFRSQNAAEEHIQALVFDAIPKVERLLSAAWTAATQERPSAAS